MQCLFNSVKVTPVVVYLKLLHAIFCMWYHENLSSYVAFASELQANYEETFSVTGNVSH